jgi:hypothetical protein
VSATFVCTDNDSLREAVDKAARPDRIVTAFDATEPHPLLGFSTHTGRWFVASWCGTQPCGVWTVGADGKPSCRVPAET